MPIRAAFEQVFQDFRFALRNVSKAPGFAASAILSLALGIGATTAIFSVIYGVILHPFPYAHPETLFSFRVSQPDHSFYFYPNTPDDYLDVAERSRVFEGVISSTISDVFWTGTGQPQRLRGNFVTTNTFQIMGVAPLLGRALQPADGQPEADPVAVLGYRFWMRQFGGDPRILGRALRLNDRVRTVVGVMPPRFMWRGADVYLPIVFQRGKTVEGVRQAFFMGRLKPGVTIAQAQTDLHPIFLDMMARRRGERSAAFRVNLDDFYETFPSDIRQSLWILFGAVTLLLLIACTNVSSLLLARAAARGREIAIRRSLGASRLRIVRQLLTESALIGLAAAALGVLLAFGGLRAILSIVPPNTIPDEAKVSLNIPVLLFTLAISLAAAFLFGLAPALQASRTDFAAVLKRAGRGVSGAFREARLRNAFVIAEVALAMILLVGASLVIRTLLKLEQLPFGADPDRILTMSLPLPAQRYDTVAKRNAFFNQLMERVQAIPGVTSIALNTYIHPFANFGSDLTVSGSGVHDRNGAVVSEISSGYPDLLGIRLIQGRAITADDVHAGRRVALVNAKLSAHYFPTGTALGASVQLTDLTAPPLNLTAPSFQVVGIVADTRNVGLRRDIYPEVFIPFTATGLLGAGGAALLVSASVPVATLVNPIEAQLHAIDPDQPVMDVLSLRDMLDAWGFSEPRFSVFLFGIFAGLGLLLAVLGIYAVINYSVVRQTQEIGVRMALGAQPGAILGMVLRSGAKLLAMGTLAGLIGSLSLARFTESMIWGVSSFDPVSFAAVIVILTATGLIACVVPAFRASRVDPMLALRDE